MPNSDDLPALTYGSPITIALKWSANIKNEERLVHTYVFPSGGLTTGDTFQANDDDRAEHRLSDLGITWLAGHVPFDSLEAQELIRRAERAEAETMP